MKIGDTATVFLSFAIGFIFMFMIAVKNSTPDRVWREEAIKAHAGEYYLDDKHEIQWRWLNCP